MARLPALLWQVLFIVWLQRPNNPSPKKRGALGPSLIQKHRETNKQKEAFKDSQTCQGNTRREKERRVAVEQRAIRRRYLCITLVVCGFAQRAPKQVYCCYGHQPHGFVGVPESCTQAHGIGSNRYVHLRTPHEGMVYYWVTQKAWH